MTQQKLCTYISAPDLNRMLQRKEPSRDILLLDVRSPAEFADLHLQKAVNVPLDVFANEINELNKDTEMVVICKSGKRAKNAAEMLMDSGFQPKILEDGLTGWLACGLPAEAGKERLSVERQTQLTIGVGILTGLALSAAISRWFLVLPAIFGAGLTYAGLSGNCGLAVLLAKAPWNQRHKSKEPEQNQTKTGKPTCCN